MTASVAELSVFAQQNPRLWVLTGAGVSTDSGIPAYRDRRGRWLRSDPIQHQDFIHNHSARQRYWARGLLGWQYVQQAQPNAAHNALAKMEKAGRITQLVTQNVDGLHQAAGNQAVIDLHGRLQRVICLQCNATSARAAMQHRLVAANPQLGNSVSSIRPDGDAEVDALDLSQVTVPNCQTCDGILKPDVVFFGASVPKPRVRQALDSLTAADALLVVGSSLQVFSGYRFCKAAQQLGKPIAIINQGVTRADAIATLKIEQNCGAALTELSTL
ncbi:MAG: NAD-dependent protein deacetylase [Pseudomonadales bacterium]